MEWLQLQSHVSGISIKPRNQLPRLGTVTLNLFHEGLEHHLSWVLHPIRALTQVVWLSRVHCWAYCSVKGQQKRAQDWDVESNKVLNNPSRHHPQSLKGVVGIIFWRQQSSFFQQDRQRMFSVRSCAETWHSQQRPTYSVPSRFSTSLVPPMHVQLIGPTGNTFFKPTLF